MSSRLERNDRGQLICTITTASPGLHVGDVFVVGGNEATTDGRCWTFTGRSTARNNPLVTRRRTQGGGVVRQTWPASFPERARDLHATGLTCQEVADQLGCPFTTAKSWIWPAGHERQKQKRREAREAPEVPT